ncbi:MAG: sigma-54-dependent Fis family transcriptional regulator [Nitrospinota bacterium]|nr:MAG: sigma-54-dependent Fis family transcriptional regulator [Nitrospinota bacterium]
MPATILVVDDDPEMTTVLQEILSEEGWEVETAGDGEEALAKLRQQEYELLLTDLRMPGMDGMTLMEQARLLYPDIQVIVITAFGSIDSAIEAMKQGAYDYITKPFHLDEMLLTIHKALKERALHREVVRLRQEVEQTYEFANILGKSPAMQHLFTMMRRVAQSTANVLITGESGTGKELVAKAIHYHSSRKQGPFIPVNCGAIPEELLESELFGYVRGAFTGAQREKMGLFEAAHGGSLFLDEVSEMPASLQVKLLRAIQEKEVRRIGATQARQVDVRIIAATNRDLLTEVEQGRFREDLYYRLNVLPLHIPPLRERPEDIPLLATHFLRKYAERNGKAVQGISEPALKLLLDYPWPGNVRELENVIERAVILGQYERITPADLPEMLTARRPEYALLERGKRQRLTLEELEREYILQVLEEVKGNKQKAAERLGIDRKTLYRRLEQYQQLSQDAGKG